MEMIHYSAASTGRQKNCIMHWPSKQDSNFKPTIARILQKAEKNLSPHSLHHTLGVDSTLPQDRPFSTRTTFLSVQDQYLVWYFFYGTLSDPNILSRQLLLPEKETPGLKPARACRGMITIWASRYRALVDGPEDAYVDGFAYCDF